MVEEYGKILIKPGESSQFKDNSRTQIVTEMPKSEAGSLQRALREVYGSSGGGGSSKKVDLGSAPELKDLKLELEQKFSSFEERFVPEGNRLLNLSALARDYPREDYIRKRREEESKYKLYDRPIEEVRDLKYNYDRLIRELSSLNPETDSERIKQVENELRALGAKKRIYSREVVDNDLIDTTYWEAPTVGFGFIKKREIPVDVLDTGRMSEEKPTYTGIVLSSLKYSGSKNVEEGLLSLGFPKEGIGTKQLSKDIAYVGQGIKSLWENIKYDPLIRRSKEGILLPGESIIIPSETREGKITTGTEITGSGSATTTNIFLPELTLRSGLQNTSDVMKNVEENPELFYLKAGTVGEVTYNIAPYVLAPPLIQVEFLGKLGEITARKGNLLEGLKVTAKKYPFETLGFTLKTGTDIYRGVNKFFNEPIVKRVPLKVDKRTDEVIGYIDEPRTITDPVSGKEITIQKGTSVWDVAKQGEATVVTTRARELFGARVRLDLVDDTALGIKTTYIPANPIYSGNPYVDKAGREQAINLLEKFGVKPGEAGSILKLTRPGLFEERVNVDLLTTYGDDTASVIARGTKTTTSVPGEVNGFKFMEITPRTKYLEVATDNLANLDLTKFGGSNLNIYKFGGILQGAGKPEAFFGAGGSTKLTGEGGKYTDPITGDEVIIKSNVGDYNLYRDVSALKRTNIPEVSDDFVDTGIYVTDSKGNFLDKLFQRSSPETSRGYVVVKQPTIPDDEGVKVFIGEGKRSSSDYFKKLYEVAEQKKVDILSSVSTPTKFSGVTTTTTTGSASKTFGVPESLYYGKGGVSTVEEVILRMPPGYSREIGALVGTGIRMDVGVISTTIEAPVIKVEERQNNIPGEIIITKTIPTSRESQGVTQIIGQVPILQQRVIELPKQTTKQKSSLLTETFKPSKYISKFIPTIKTLESERTPGKSKLGLTKGLFKVKVRKRGEDVTIGEFETLPKARRKLKSELIETISASGIIERAGKPLKFEEVGIYGTQFRRAKSDPFRVVQKKEARIKTGGEITQILKTRKSKGGWFR